MPIIIFLAGLQSIPTEITEAEDRWSDEQASLLEC